MSRLNLSSQSPMSNLDGGGFATFTNGTIYKSATDEIKQKKTTQ